MNETRMLAELARLPDAELLQASKITDPPGADVYYSGRTVVQLLAKERERCADACIKLYFEPRHFSGYNGEATADDCAKLIRQL